MTITFNTEALKVAWVPMEDWVFSLRANRGEPKRGPAGNVLRWIDKCERWGAVQPRVDHLEEAATLAHQARAARQEWRRLVKLRDHAIRVASADGYTDAEIEYATSVAATQVHQVVKSTRPLLAVSDPERFRRKSQMFSVMYYPHPNLTEAQTIALRAAAAEYINGRRNEAPRPADFEVIEVTDA